MMRSSTAYTTQVASPRRRAGDEAAFADNQHVSAGQTLVLIDPRDFQAKTGPSEGAAGERRCHVGAGAVAGRGVQQANVDQANANVRVADADLLQANQDYDRFQAINPPER